MRRPLVRLSALLLVCGTCLVVTASPCFACACVPQTPKQVLGRADAAFVGEVTSQRTLDAMTTAQTFRVDAVFKGAVHQSEDVVASMGAAGGSDCAILFPEGSPVAVVVQQQGDHWISDACSLLTLAQLRRVAPPPEPPLPGQGAPAGGPTAPPTTAPATSAGPSDAGGGISGAGAIAGGLLAIAAIAFVLSLESRRAARERRTREPDEAELVPEGSTPEGAEPDPADPPEPSG